MGASAWQEPAWVFNATVPELGFAHDYVRDSMSRVRPYPAILSDDPDEGPIPLTDNAAPKGLDPDLADEICQRLAPYPDFMGAAALKLDVAGEVYIGLIPDDDEIDGEACRVFSNRELIASGSGWRIKDGPDDSQGTPIPDGAPFWRIWTPDPEFSVLPFSPMVRLNGTCERLLVLSRLIKAFALSRLATTGKIIAIADEFSLESANPDGSSATEGDGDGEGMIDSFFDDFMAAGAEAILDPESASAVMNMVIRGPKELVKDGIAIHDISRTMEETMMKLREEAKSELANGLNLPREVVLGVGDTNHWNAEQIKEQAWLNHLEPRAYAILAATTTAFYRPALLANGVDPDIVRRSVLWYDPKWFLGEPDRSESADFGYEHFMLSGEAWRSAKNFTEDDVPTEEEVAWRVRIAQELNVKTTLKDDGLSEPPTVEPADTPAPDEVQPNDKPAETPEKADTSAPPAAPAAPAPTSPAAKAPAAPAAKKPAPPKKKAAGTVTEIATAVAAPAKLSAPQKAAQPAKPAAPGKVAPPAKVAALGNRLVSIERDLRTRLLEASNASVGRALERAGVKVRTKLGTRAAGAAGKTLLAQCNGLPPGEIPALVGRGMVESFGLNDQQLLDGAVADLKVRYHTLVKRAQYAALAVTVKASSAADAPDYDLMDETAAPNRDTGWDVLSAGLLGLAATALYNPHPSKPDLGEYDGTSLVPPGLVRAALDAAGGADMGHPTSVRGAEIPASDSAVADSSSVSGGATAGPDMLSTFDDQANLSVDSYTWIYGDAPRAEFPPHSDLDGESFSSWEDDVLANGEGWPDVAYFMPGDHDGCGCDWSGGFVEGDTSDVTLTDAGATDLIEGTG